jgi:hypothetical protein
LAAPAPAGGMAGSTPSSRRAGGEFRRSRRSRPVCRSRWCGVICRRRGRCATFGVRRRGWRAPGRWRGGGHRRGCGGGWPCRIVLGRGDRMSEPAAMTTVQASARAGVSAAGRGPRPLWVDPVAHRRELARFGRYVVVGPSDSNCAIWCGAIGDDGYGQNCAVNASCCARTGVRWRRRCGARGWSRRCGLCIGAATTRCVCG